MRAMNRDIDNRGLAVLVGLSIGVVLLVAAGFAEATDEDLSSWLASIATVAAFAAAAVAASYASKVYAIESRREERIDEQDRRAQASLVAAWGHSPSFRLGDQNEQTGYELPAAITGARVYLRNASEVPVTAVTVTVFVHLTWPEGYEAYRLGSATVDTLAPGGAPEIVAVPANHRIFDLESYGVNTDRATIDINVGLEFRDAAGVLWSRNTRGALLEVRQSEVPPGVDAAPRD